MGISPNPWGPLRDEINRRLKAGAVVVSNSMKEVLSVPAPRRRVLSRKGTWYYRATTPATDGAPPRKLSGRLRTSVASELDAQAMRSRAGTNVKYGRRHQFKRHPWADVAVEKARPQLEQILGGGVSVEMGASN